jgi:hypothetical protein
MSTVVDTVLNWRTLRVPLTDREIRMWDVEQSIKWRESTRSDTPSVTVANAYYKFAKDGGKLEF